MHACSLFIDKLRETRQATNGYEVVTIGTGIYTGIYFTPDRGELRDAIVCKFKWMEN